MSALLSMCRTRILVLALAAWAGIAQGSPRTTTKPQHTTPTATAAKASRPSAASKTTARSTTARRSTKSRAPSRPSVKSSPVAKTRTAAKAGAARARVVGAATSKATTTKKIRATSAAAPARHAAPVPPGKDSAQPPAQPSTTAASKPVPAAGSPAAEPSSQVKPAVIKRSARSTRIRAYKEDASLRIARGPMPPPLRGSAAILAHQNERLEAEGLERIENDTDLNNRIAQHLLIPLPSSSALAVNSDLPENRRYCRSWTAQFLSDLARAHQAAFHRPLMVSSAVRTIEYQKELMHINGNAAPAEGDIVSPHVMGATIDIAKNGLSRQEIAWMRIALQEQVSAGNIDVEEEFQQACFHITVYKSYASARKLPAPRHSASTQSTGGAAFSGQ